MRIEEFKIDSRYSGHMWHSVGERHATAHSLAWCLENRLRTGDIKMGEAERLSNRAWELHREAIEMILVWYRGLTDVL